MGKAKRKLMAARKECYPDIKQQKEVLPETIDPRADMKMRRDYDIDTAVLLRKRLINYARGGNYPMCEYLDLENVENYVRWILKYAQC